MKLAVVFVGLFSALCAGLVVWAVLTHTEAGLVRQDVRWNRSRFPLKVFVHGYDVSEPDADKAGKHALQQINERLGFQAFQQISLADAADIDIEIGVPQDTKPEPPSGAMFDSLAEPGGMYRLIGNQESRWDKCYIATSNTGTDQLLDQVLQHELGHCLGLAHDDFDSSIMYPVQFIDDEAFPPRITDSDRKALRELYAP